MSFLNTKRIHITQNILIDLHDLISDYSPKNLLLGIKTSLQHFAKGPQFQRPGLIPSRFCFIVRNARLQPKGRVSEAVSKRLRYSGNKSLLTLADAVTQPYCWSAGRSWGRVPGSQRKASCVVSCQPRAPVRCSPGSFTLSAECAGFLFLP